MKKPINSNNIFVRGYLSLFLKNSVIHMHDMAIYTNEGHLFVLGLSLEFPEDSYSCILLTLHRSMSCFTFLYQLPPSSSCTVFDIVSSHIDRGLSINPSAKAFNFFKDFYHVAVSIFIDFPSNLQRKGVLLLRSFRDFP